MPRLLVAQVKSFLGFFYGEAAWKAVGPMPGLKSSVGPTPTGDTLPDTAVCKLLAGEREIA